MLQIFRRLAQTTLFFAATTVGPTAAEKPNILFIAIDDLRPELGCYGVDAIKSPHIDKLAQASVVFNRAYCQVAVCNPSRVSLMTGLRPDTSRVWDLVTRFRETVPDVVTLPQQFMKHGYYALSFGKIYHNPWPDNASWNEPHRWPVNSRLWSDNAKRRLVDFRKTMRANGKSPAAISRMRGPATEIVDLPDREHIDGAICDQALKAMTRLAEKDQPFFLAAGFVRPHLPFVVPRKYWEMYDRDSIPLAKQASLPGNSPKFAMNTMYELRDYMDYSNTPDPRSGSLTENQQRELKHGYYAAVSMIDTQVGRLLNQLKKLGIDDKTIVVLWGDHGWKLGEHNSWCKQSNYEIDARVPLIIRAPQAMANGQHSSSLVEFVDIYPTLCELAGIPVPGHVEGKSLLPILNDSKQSVKDVAISQFRRRHGKQQLMGYAARTDQYRYVEWIDRRNRNVVAKELYDHSSDSGENNNIADAADPDLLAGLSKKLWLAIPQPPAFVEPKAARPSLTIRNERSETLTVYWLPDGKEHRKAGEIKPGESMTQRTTMGHRFQVLGSNSKLDKTIVVRRIQQTVRFTTEKPASQTKSAADRPNVVVIMGDDWSWPHAGALGDKTVKTPTFDRIAREGVLFRNAFVTAPSCTSSRFALVTGQNPWRLGDGANLGGSLAADVPVYPDILAEAGYKTGFCRKGAGPSKHIHRGNDPFGKRYEDFDEFMNQKEPDESFCFWYGAGEPHRPYDWQASKKSEINLKSIEVPGCLPDNKTVRTDIGDYYLRIQKLDQLAGRILARLEQSGELENTIVVMTGDNGMPFPRCKATLYDGGTRVPLAIRWGKSAASGRTVKSFVTLTDLAPTILEATGQRVPDVMTGRSLMSELKSAKTRPSNDARNHVLTGRERHVYQRPSRAIRSADFLYIRNFGAAAWPTGEIDGPQPDYDFETSPWPTKPPAFSFDIDPSPTKQWMRHHPEFQEGYFQTLAFGRRTEEELYDLRNDPEQLSNVVAETKYAKVRNQLSLQLTSEFRSDKDPRFALPNHATLHMHGWTIHLHDRLWQESAEKTKIALTLMDVQLQRVVDVVPAKALKDLRKVPIWMNPTYDGVRPTAEYHPGAGWLKDNGRNVDMVKSVEITSVANFEFENKRMPYFMLHELAHAYHDRVLGFGHPAVVSAYRDARDSGTYESVRRFNGRRYISDKAYALSNHKEYFAESTEAFLGRNDFFPFDEPELKKHDPQIHALLGQLWGTEGTQK